MFKDFGSGITGCPACLYRREKPVFSVYTDCLIIVRRSVKTVLPKFEHRAQPVIPPHQFIIRLAHSGIIALALIAVSLFIGMVGYHILESLSWIDAFLNASMLLGGMGPVHIPVTFGGKLFAGVYALYCGLAVILVAGVILAPVAHRFLHRFHMESRNQ